jgi:SLA1 homology domain 1, SHD1
VRTLLFCAAIALSNVASHVAAEVRTWKDRTGSYSVEAEFVSLADGKVTLKRANGALAVVPLEKLSDVDRQFVEKQSASATPDPASAALATDAAGTKSVAGGPLVVGDTKIEIMGLQIARPVPPSREPQGGGFTIMAGPLGSGGTTLNVSLANSNRNIIGMDAKKSRIAALVDDKKTNLLQAAKREDDFGGSMFGPLQAHIASGGHQCTLEVRAPNIPARGAAMIRLEATIVLQCGADEKTVEQKDVALKHGSKVTIGPVPMTVERVEDSNFGDAKMMLTLASSKSMDAIKEIAFLAADGSTIKHDSMGQGQSGFNDNITYEASYGLHQKVDAVTIQLTYFSKVEELPLPLKIDVGLGL